MSDDPEVRKDVPERSAAPTPKKKSRVPRVLGWMALSLVGLAAVLALVATWYTGTDDFQHRVGGEVVSTLENATGGRVELGHLTFSLWHLAIEVDGLVIHGTEGPGQMPYLSASKIFLRLHLNVILTHIRGLGPQSRISLRYLRVEQPRFHLIVDKDGHSNAPVPKRKSTSNESVQDTLLDLQARKVELADGLAVINDRAIPFNVAAKDLSAEVHYERKPDQYGATIDFGDLQTKLANEPEVQSKLHLTAELGRDKFALKSLDFSVTPSGGPTTHLTADALVQHFASPQWQATVKGNVDVKQLGYLTDVAGLKAGTLELAVHGHSCVVSPQVAQKNPHFWQGRQKKLPPSAKVLPPDPNCAAGYLLVGSMKAHSVVYRDENVRLPGINGGADLHITPTELLFTALSGYLPGGGDAKGQLKIENWLGETPANAAATSATTVAAATTVNAGAKTIGARAPVTSLKSVPVERAHAYLTVVVERIPLRTIMDVTAPVGYGDLGFDTAITGPTTVEWGGPATEISDTVQVQAHLTFAPTGVTRKGALSNVPVTGEVVGHYDGRIEVVNIAALTLRTPSSSLVTNGVLGVNVGDPLTNLQVNLQTRDLGEFDQLLRTLAFEENGRKGTAAIPPWECEFCGDGEGRDSQP
jgi:translocation and assembly module TamB